MSAGADPARLAFTVHELRSPVAALAALAEASRAAHDDQEAIRRLVELALAACGAIERVLDDAVLGLTRLDGVDLARIAKDASATASLGGARIRLEVSPGVKPVSADPVRLQQALDNLIRNAVLYGAEDGEVVVRVGAEGGGRTSFVSVSNSGEGIPPDEQARIFEPGVRFARGRPGSGLGLAVVRAVAEAHGGAVSVESAPGQGAMFTISLPSGAS